MNEVSDDGELHAVETELNDGLDEHTHSHEASTASNGTSKSPSKSVPLPPTSVERSGLCVVCQDEEVRLFHSFENVPPNNTLCLQANIVVVDCGHLAMCRGCSDLVMNTSRECPLCRTRIVTPQRLLRVFKT